MITWGDSVEIENIFKDIETEAAFAKIEMINE